MLTFCFTIYMGDLVLLNLLYICNDNCDALYVKQWDFHMALVRRRVGIQKRSIFCGTHALEIEYKNDGIKKNLQ